MSLAQGHTGYGILEPGINTYNFGIVVYTNTEENVEDKRDVQQTQQENDFAAEGNNFNQ